MCWKSLANKTILSVSRQMKIHRKPDFSPHIFTILCFILHLKWIISIIIISFHCEIFKTKIIASGTVIRNVNCNVFSCKSLCKMQGLQVFENVLQFSEINLTYKQHCIKTGLLLTSLAVIPFNNLFPINKSWKNAEVFLKSQHFIDSQTSFISSFYV